MRRKLQLDHGKGKHSKDYGNALVVRRRDIVLDRSAIDGRLLARVHDSRQFAEYLERWCVSNASDLRTGDDDNDVFEIRLLDYKSLLLPNLQESGDLDILGERDMVSTRGYHRIAHPLGNTHPYMCGTRAYGYRGLI